MLTNDTMPTNDTNDDNNSDLRALQADHLARLLTCSNVLVTRYTGTRSVSGPGCYWEAEPIADVSSIRFGDYDLGPTRHHADCPPVSSWTIDTLPDGAMVIIEHTTYSDYSGSTVERSNETAIAEDNKNADWLKSLYGGHGSSGLAIDVRAWLDSLDPEYGDSPLLETIESLEDYPVVDDEAISQLEMELADSDWDCWADSDFRRAVEKSLQIDDVEPNDSATWREFFETTRESVNVYWEAESAVSCHVDVDRVAGAVTIEALRDVATFTEPEPE